MKRVVILGSTGSIGTQALNVVRQHPDKFKVVGLSTNTNIEKLREQIEEFRPEAICITDEKKGELFKTDVVVHTGENGLKTIATLESNLLINSVVGSAGLMPTLAAIKKGIAIGLANKETLVLAGEIVIHEAKNKMLASFPLTQSTLHCFNHLNLGKRQRLGISI